MASEWAVIFAAVDRVLATASGFMLTGPEPDDHALVALQEALTRASTVVPSPPPTSAEHG